MKFRPLHDWVLVVLEDEPELAGKALALWVGTSPYRFGTVSAKGPKVHDLHLIAGERVMFRRENLEHRQGRAISYVLNDDEWVAPQALVRMGDILLVTEGRYCRQVQPTRLSTLGKRPIVPVGTYEEIDATATARGLLA